ncbi:hypothetical protein Pla108_13860 [Botrimarina colliarenosi]|uniref:DUF1559 domain-containing protein n=1 Tax=Botrimarina colliarenosi TaxID=2528001 RepID=A0A5C6AK60_9BACT|nr:DUF1559 domain-containing protein [Botrimarina colliarenosi]TWU00435.1 hypothetical protein Pla108_13860 [Botrimarina colliarenosi]
MRIIRSTGVSVIELLIVISIIGMLLSLLLPAVQSSRESARKVDCLSRSRQLGLAIQQYHGATNELPPSRISDRYLTWAALVLPYLEQQTIYDQMDPMRVFSVQSDQVRLTPIEAFLCPTRSHDSLVSNVRKVPGIVGDYAAVTSTFLLTGNDGRYFDGSLIVADSTPHERYPRSTLSNWKSRTHFKDITDGTSKTFLLGEGSLWMIQRTALYDGNYNTGAFLGDDDYPEEYLDIAPRILPHPIAESESQPKACIGSAHPDTVTMTMVDGSVRPVRKDVDIKVLESLVTRAGGETTSLTDVDN